MGKGNVTAAGSASEGRRSHPDVEVIAKSKGSIIVTGGVKVTWDLYKNFSSGYPWQISMKPGFGTGINKFGKSEDECSRVQSCWCAKPIWRKILKKDEKIQGARYAKGTVVSFREEGCTGSMSSAFLAKNQIIQGKKCAKGTTVDFHDNGTIMNMTPSETQTINGIRCAGGKHVRLHDNGNVALATLAKDQIIGGRKYFKTDIGLNRDGSVDFGELAKDQTIDGIPCVKGVLISYNTEGKLKNATLSRNHKIGGVDFERGTEVSFSNGKLLYATLILKRDQVINNIPFPRGTKMEFDSNGKLDYANLTKIQLIDGVSCSASETVSIFGNVSFHDSGRLSQAVLSKDQTIKGVELPSQSEVSLTEEGNVYSAFLPTGSWTIQGIRCEGKQYVRFHKNGKLQSALLSEDQVVGETRFPKGAYVELSEDGTPLNENK